MMRRVLQPFVFTSAAGDLLRGSTLLPGRFPQSDSSIVRSASLYADLCFLHSKAVSKLMFPRIHQHDAAEVLPKWFLAATNLSDLAVSDRALLRNALNATDSSVSSLAKASFEAAKSLLATGAPFVEPDRAEETGRKREIWERETSTLLTLAANNGSTDAMIECANLMRLGAWPSRTADDVKSAPATKEAHSAVLKSIRNLQRANRRKKAGRVTDFDSEEVDPTPPLDPAASLLVYRMACQAGSIRAHRILAQVLLQDALEIDDEQERVALEKEACEALKVAAEAGDTRASFLLAHQLLENEKSSQDDKNYAIDLLRKGFTAKDPQCGLLLGLLLLQRESKLEAEDVFRRAGELGSGEALVYLARLEMEKPGISETDPAVLEILSKAVDCVDGGEACHMMGDRCINSDPLVALDWYVKAGEKGYVDGYLSAGAILFSRQEYGRAFEMYSSAARTGEIEAWRRVASMHAQGLGVQRDVELAERLFQFVERAQQRESEN